MFRIDIHETNNTNRLITLLFTFFFIALILITTYPTIDDFTFSNINNAVKAGVDGNFDIGTDPFPGFTASIIMLYEICKIPYEVLITLPLLSISFILLFLAIIKRSIKDFVFPFIATVCLLHFSMRPILFCHTLGLLLLLVMLLLMFLRMEHPNQQLQTSILTIILLLSLNFMSYKITAFAIFFLCSLYIFEIYEKKADVKSVDNIYHRFGLLTLVGFIFVLAFNQFFYKSFIPTIRRYESPLLGIQKLISIFFAKQKYDPLSEYYFRGEMGHAPLYIAWIVIIGFLLVACAVIISKKVLMREGLLPKEKIILAFGVSASFIFIIYTHLGMAEISYLILTGLLGCGVMFTINSNYCMLLGRLSALSLFLLSIFMFILASQNGDYGGQKDIRHFQYLMSPAKWYVDHINNGNMSPHTSTDVLTSGYLWKTALSENRSNAYRPAVFSNKEILLILEADSYPLQTDGRVQHIYVINYKERHFAIMGWYTINSWSRYRNNITSNPYLNIFYSSGWIDTCEHI